MGFRHHIGSLEVQGPLQGQHFACRADRRCTVSLLTKDGVRSLDGAHLLLSSGDCSGSAGKVVTNASLPAAGCGSYLTGCTFTWPSPLTVGSFRLCWCSPSSTCIGEVLVDVGLLEVGGSLSGE